MRRLDQPPPTLYNEARATCPVQFSSVLLRSVPFRFVLCTSSHVHVSSTHRLRRFRSSRPFCSYPLVSPVAFPAAPLRLPLVSSSADARPIFHASARRTLATTVSSTSLFCAACLCVPLSINLIEIQGSSRICLNETCPIGKFIITQSVLLVFDDMFFYLLITTVQYTHT